MKHRQALIDFLKQSVPVALATDLVDNFVELRRDVAASTLGRASAGKFAETVVQVLQHLENGNYDPQPAVDAYLKGLDSRASTLPDGLRICGARIARAMYTLRNKRNIAHKGAVDPNVFDLRFLLAAAQWLLAELIRTSASTSMDEAGRFVSLIQVPIGTLVEDYDGKKLVLTPGTTRDEILLVLDAHHPEAVPLSKLKEALDRRSPGTVGNTARVLWRERVIEGDGTSGYRLTGKGLTAAQEVIRRLVKGDGEA